MSNEENFEESLDNNDELSDTENMEATEETVESILGDLYDKIYRLNNLREVCISKVSGIKDQIGDLKVKQKGLEAESKRAGHIAKKLKGIVG